ncbi:nucleotidyltransferase domain-containing protein [Nocardioides baculatus]|uniref:Nucleotidyltransferase domain-containing protein n=1 Tax=Nocardioides baculatus TaxID=2801337 RepID=A0ABS1LA87_9ACTN|nr:nucleotidyltransferase domain-containing protein [Nocardioides baculatus]MBL0748586.1 nucleotidyltransferase domain-containing protein [Nocardioides baculatus]
MEHPAVDALAAELAQRGWVSDLWLHGSLATGDHRPGVSDIDLVAITTRPLDASRLREVDRVHRRLDATWPGSALGCAYVDGSRLDDLRVEHPTWTHGRLVERRLSSMVRAELLDIGRPLLGRDPAALLAPMSRDDIKAAVREELTGYWSWAVRRPWLFLDSRHADLALVSMARARTTIATGTLMTKTEALAQVRAPARVVDGLRRRRTAGSRRTPIAPLLAHHAWHDTRRTIGEHGRPG